MNEMQSLGEVLMPLLYRVPQGQAGAVIASKLANTPVATRAKFILNSTLLNTTKLLINPETELSATCQ
jgi:hypothetical protein